MEILVCRTPPCPTLVNALYAISVLCVLAGSAQVHGLSVEHDMAAIYGIMGVCPQHDLLWEQLTAREHLMFYARLKNLRVCSRLLWCVMHQLYEKHRLLD